MARTFRFGGTNGCLKTHKKIITHRPYLLLNCTIDQLIIQPRMEWDHQLLDQLFIPYDADAIKSIPLSNLAPTDKLIWLGKTNGQYSVMSGYRFLVHEENNSLPGSSHLDALQQVWNTIWSLHIPKKCQIFAWRATREALPTKLNLRKRQIPLDSECETCKDSIEDELHALWSCKQVQSVWDNEAWLYLMRSSTDTL